MLDSLRDVIGQAYRAKAMGQGDMAQALSVFRSHAGDAAFMDAARAELAHVTAVDNSQCFVSKLTMDFLNEALANV